MVGLRNVVVHEYFAVSWGTIWSTATRDVPEIEQRIREIVDGLGEVYAPASLRARADACGSSSEWGNYSAEHLATFLARAEAEDGRGLPGFVRRELVN